MIFSRKELNVFSPLNGEVYPIEQTPEPSFASKQMGDGFVIFPNDEGIVYAPFDCVVKFVFPSKHAIGLEANNHTGILIHIGIDSGSLNGKGFDVKVSEGQKVNRGDVLIEFDAVYLQQYLTAASPIIFTSLNGRTFELVKKGVVTTNDVVAIVR